MCRMFPTAQSPSGSILRAMSLPPRAGSGLPACRRFQCSGGVALSLVCSAGKPGSPRLLQISGFRSVDRFYAVPPQAEGSGSTMFVRSVRPSVRSQGPCFSKAVRATLATRCATAARDGRCPPTPRLQWPRRLRRRRGVEPRPQTARVSKSGPSFSTWVVSAVNVQCLSTRFLSERVLMWGRSPPVAMFATRDARRS